MNRSGVTNLEVCTSTMLMKVNKQERDDRVTNRPVLRRSSLDEMPQFFNVLLET
jgi:lipopolysaccharide/colanic/teichoic acid biosynthesis glycosyltransferase